MKFNINNEIKVRLTDFGINDLKRQHEELRKIAPSIGEFRYPRVDSDGYSSFQGWVLMAKFGHLMFCGGENPFDLDVIIEEKTK